MHRKFEGNSARVANAVAHPFGKVQMMAVARNEIAAGLRNPYNGLAALKLFPGKPVIQIALQIERRHSRIAWIVPPGAAAKVFGLTCCHAASLSLRRPKIIR